MKQEKARRAAFDELRSPLPWQTQATLPILMYLPVDEGENGVWELRRTKQLSWVSHSTNYLFNLQPLFTDFNLSDSGAECCHVTRTSGWQQSGSKGLFFCRSKGDFIHMCHNLYRFCFCCLYMKAN